MAENTELQQASGGAPVTAEPASAPTAPAHPVFLKGEIEIQPDQRLHHLDQGPVKAYAALGKGKEKAFALVCEKGLVPKINLASKYLMVNNQHVPRLIGAGIVDWSPVKQERYVFIYENKLGLPLANPSNFMAMGFKADQVLHGFVKKIFPLLKNFRDVDFVYGSFRTTNIYTGGGTGFDKVMLGENLSTPPAYLYTPIYEPIERAIGQPLGRGSPSYSDDLYSFGVMLAIMLRNADPLDGWSDEDILKHKIEQGSYHVLMGKERLSGAMLELLRGLLQDDVAQRWTIEDIATWLDGQRVTHKQASPLKVKAARPLDFFGEKYLRPQILSMELNKSPVEIVKLSDNGDLKLWVNRSIQDKALEENVEHAANAAKELGVLGESYPHRTAAYIAAALGPDMPIIYRHLRFLPEAFGRMMAESFVQNKDLNYLAEVLQSSLASFWASMNPNLTPDIMEIISKFDTCKGFLRQPGQGYGLERCLYFLCAEAPCMSEKIKDFYVRTPEELVLAYERISTTSNRPDSFFDRHIISFLSIKDRSVIDPYIPDLNSSEGHRIALASLRIFSSIQRRGKMVMLPGLTSWLSEKMDPLVNRYSDREQRVKLKAQLAKVRDKGDVSKIEQIFDNPHALQMDQAGFHQAMHTYVAFKNEYSKLEHDLNTDSKFGYSAGHHTSMLISGIIATIIVMAIIVYKISTKTAF